MEKAKHSVEFETEVTTDGRIRFSRDVPAEMRLIPGSKVTVRIVGGVLSHELAQLNVTEDEIEHIGTIQFEDREHVVRFLESQGSLSRDKAFCRRAKGIFR
jgi:hypothetical protein